MRGWSLGAGAVVLAIALSAGAIAKIADNSEPNVAYVDGEPISRSQYDEYLSVLSADGAVAVEPWQVVQSMVNQTLALREAERLGFSATDADIDEAVDVLTGEGISVDMLSGTGGLDAFRERVRVRMLFERVKASVTRDVRATDEDIRRFVLAHSAMITNTEWEAVKAEVEPAVRELLIGRVWSEWLAGRRACASVQIVIADVQLQSAAPGAEC